jgi:hypothetical protein
MVVILINERRVIYCAMHEMGIVMGVDSWNQERRLRLIRMIYCIIKTLLRKICARQTH